MQKGSRLSRNILILGFISFFADISSEMVYPIIPLYLTAAFGATPVLVGVIEGIAESLASLLKVFSGYISDRYHRKKPLAFFGYATGLLYKAALLFATSWTGVLAARIIDRFGKGMRTAPRDVMIAESAEEGRIGGAFGLHKALDMAGSAVGILASWLLLKRFVNGYRSVFALSALPVLLALILFAFVREKQEPRETKPREFFWRKRKELNRNLKLYLLVSFLFTLGNSSNTFLLLKAASVGFSDTDVILLYFVYNLVAALLSIPFGKRSDRLGRKRVLVAGYCVFSVVYLGFAFVTSKPLLVAVFALYGLYTAMVTGVERAFIAEIAPPELKGTMLGLQSTLVGVALLPASVVAGALWYAVGSYAPFCLGAALSAAAALLLRFGLKPGRESGSEQDACYSRGNHV